MTDEVERLLGTLDARTQGILTAVTDLKGNVNDLFAKVNQQKSQFDKLQTEHNDRMARGAECTQTVNVPTIPKTMMALISGGTSVGVLALFVVILLLLKKWGLL